MSLMAQAPRLVSLCQRCRSMGNGWRRDIRTSANTTHVVPSQPHPGNNPLMNRSVGHEITNYGIHQLSLQQQTQRLRRTLTKLSAEETVDADRGSTADGGADCLPTRCPDQASPLGNPRLGTNLDLYCYHKCTLADVPAHGQPLPFTKLPAIDFAFLTLGKHNPSTATKSKHKTYSRRAGLKVKQISNSAASLQNDARGTYHNHESEQRSGQRRGGKKYLHGLGILGLFSGITDGDIEEEKAKLDNEKRAKKMKPIELLIAKGVLSMCDKDYAKAEELFHDALLMAQAENDDEQETLVFNLLASNYFEASNWEKAEKCFIDLIRRMMAKGVESNDNAILECSLKLAYIYSQNPMNYSKAKRGFEFVIDSSMAKLRDFLDKNENLDGVELSDERRDELALLGWGYDWFAKHLLSLHSYNEAIDMLQRAVTISEKVLGPLHNQTLILMNDIGTTMSMVDRHEEGLNYIKKAVEGAIASQSNELASFYVNLGLINLNLRNLTDAKRYCEFATEIAAKNPEHYSYSEIMKLSRQCAKDADDLSGE